MISRHSTFEVEQPWVCYHYGLTVDSFWPPWRSTRVLGRARIVCECAICGDRETLSIRMPRFGPVPQPASGKHPSREAFLAAHVHEGKHDRHLWARPLLNPDALGGTSIADIIRTRLDP